MESEIKDAAPVSGGFPSTLAKSKNFLRRLKRRFS
jgi:hypothetical protein